MKSRGGSMSTFLFIELPDGFKEMDIETAVKSASWAFEEDEAKAKKIAESFGFDWPLWMARNEKGIFITVYESEIEDYSEYAEEFIRQEIGLRKNPPNLLNFSGGCMCVILGKTLRIDHSCGYGQAKLDCGQAECSCGPSCRCGK